MFSENNTKRLMIELLYLGSGYETAADTVVTNGLYVVTTSPRMSPRAFALVLTLVIIVS